jgi:hypothetical protein
MRSRIWSINVIVVSFRQLKMRGESIIFLVSIFLGNKIWKGCRKIACVP